MPNLQSSGQISIRQIRDCFNGQEGLLTQYSSSNTDLMHLGYYRGRYYYNSSGSFLQFPSTNLSLADFYGAYTYNPSPPPGDGGP